MDNKYNKLGEYNLTVAFTTKDETGDKTEKLLIPLKFGMNAWGVLDELGVNLDQGLIAISNAKERPVQSALMLATFLFAGYGGHCLLHELPVEYSVYQFREWFNNEISKEEVAAATTAMMESIPKAEPKKEKEGVPGKQKKQKATTSKP